MNGATKKILDEMRDEMTAVRLIKGSDIETLHSIQDGLRKLADRIDIAVHHDLYELENQLKKTMMLNEALAGAACPGIGVGVVTVEDRPAAGNGAEIRAALVEIRRMSQWGGTDFGNPVVRGLLITLDSIRKTADAALNAPARPCDKYGDAVAAMAELKRRHNECAEEGHPCLEDCPDCGQVKCAIAWLMSPEKGGAQ